MEDNLKLLLPVHYDLDPVFDDERFLKMRARVQHDGLNYNESDFQLADMERAKNTIINIPILANVLFNEETGKPEFGSHDIELEWDKLSDDGFRLIYKEIPIGVVPETCNYTIKEYNGLNYVYVDIYIWRGYSNYAEQLIEREKDIKLSMEIEIQKYEVVDNIYKIIDYEYTGITLLNSKFETGMKNAMATTTPTDQFENINNYFNKMIYELNKSLEPNNDIKKHKGGSTKLNLRFKNKRQAIQEAMQPVFSSNDSGDIIMETYYCLEDFNDNCAYVAKIEYDENGLSEKSYCKISFVYDEESKKVQLIGDYETTEQRSDEINNLKSKIDSLENKMKDYNELEQYKKDTEIKIFNDTKNQLLEKYKDLNSLDEYKVIQESEDIVDIKELTDKFKIMFHDYYELKSENSNNLKADFSKIPVLSNTKSNSPVSAYGDLFERYGENISKEEI